ncbi:MAG: hypothetical protein LBU14_01970 [Candidatus Peribacteria bacterium]|jgi:hypothetical protein|nr:hypothetical protein [Candidatus Peribacteria bacterium]
MKNLSASKTTTLGVYSNFEMVDSTITLEDNSKKVYFYLTSNDENVKNYVADFDINIDSDLNG